MGRPQLAARQFEEGQEALADELAAVFCRRPLTDWLRLCDGEDVCVGPVATLAEAAADLSTPPSDGVDAPLGAHTDAWRVALSR